MKSIEVVAAIIIYNRKILCMQRGKGVFDYISYKFEFPGGKIEPGETAIEALCREIDEEMEFNIDPSQAEFFLTIEHQYPDFFIKMHSYICYVDTDEFTLTEHIDFKWLKRHQLDQLEWAPADIPIVKKLMEASDIEI